jgi:hypothetical protein
MNPQSTGAQSPSSAVLAGPVTEVERQRSPAPARMPEMDWRIAVHESGHVVCARYFDLTVGGSTIVASGKTGGLTWGASEHLDRAAFDETAVNGLDHDITETARGLRAGTGESLSPAADWHLRCRLRCIGSLGGGEAEKIILPGQLPLGGVGDQLQALQFAAMFCSSPNSIDAFLEFCQMEAFEIVAALRHVVLALAHELVEHRTIDGKHIDQIISQSVTDRAIADEYDRQIKWHMTVERAQNLTKRFGSELAPRTMPFQLQRTGHAG